MMDNTANNERGQVLVIVALAIIALIAMTGLAIDGSTVLADRRNAQTKPGPRRYRVGDQERYPEPVRGAVYPRVDIGVELVEFLCGGGTFLGRRAGGQWRR